MLQGARAVVLLAPSSSPAAHREPLDVGGQNPQSALRVPAIDHDGVRYDTVAPAIVPMTEAAPYLASRQRRVFGLLGVESFLRLEISHSERPAEQAT